MLENPKSKSIGELQAEIEAALSRVATTPLPVGLEPLRYLAAPEGMAARVSLRYLAEHRQIRRTADGCYWNREDGECEAIVSYELEEAEHAPTEREAQPSSSTPQGLVSRALRDLVLALDAAEREPRFREFVGIKPFRDQFLPYRGYDWTAAPQSRHKTLADAIDQGMILRSSIANPKSPEYPTTAIKLNREHPCVKLILNATDEERCVFRPVSIRGEAISSTLIAERR